MAISRSQVIVAFILSTILSVRSNEYCSVWRDISPCNCIVESHTSIYCEKMESFDRVINILKNKFSPVIHIHLRISYSTLDDLRLRSFKELNMTIVNLKLTNNDLRDLNPQSFSGLSHVTYLSLSDNLIPYIPTEILQKMPNIRTLDLGRLRVRSLHEDSLRGLDSLESFVVPGNILQEMDVNSIPSTVKKLHLGRNKLNDLNRTLCHLSKLEWLFINSNELTSLDNQLPRNAHSLKMIHASDNYIEKLPQEFKYFASLNSLFLHNNSLIRLDGVLSKAKNLETLQLEHNQLTMLQDDDFDEATGLQKLKLGYNNLTSLNNAMRPLINLTVLNVTYNLMQEFSFEEIRGLINLTMLDISFNKICRLTGFTTNVIDWESNLRLLNMDHNEIFSLNGSVSGFRNLIRLDVSYNKLTHIQPDDLIGLDRLNMLDISHNYLITLEETSKTFLPSLQELLASYNNLTILDRDFHGLPVLCWADLSHNNIIALGRDLVSKTHCRVNDGIHSDVWGVLKIDLQDNPILCDSALPEILSTMEINHTKISGLANCPTLREQPVTTKRNNFLGYIPPEITSSLPPVYIDSPHLNEPVNINPLYNIPYNSIGDISNQVKKSVEETLSAHDTNNQQNQIQGDQPKTPEFPVDIPSQNIYAQLEEQFNSDNVAKTISDHNLEPLPYQHSIYSSKNLEEDVPDPNEKYDETIALAHKLNEQLYTQTEQQEQITKLTSEIEELRTRLQQLASENERLTRNFNVNLYNLPTGHKIFGNTRPILPLEQVPVLSTIKPPNTEFERTP